MNQEIKQRWIEALRSGEYKQVKQVLASDEGYCCLGVLCKIENRLSEPLTKIAHNDYGKLHNLRYDKEDVDAEGNNLHQAYPQEYWAESIGLNWRTMQALSEMNDLDGLTFEQIADKIEAL